MKKIKEIIKLFMFSLGLLFSGIVLARPGGGSHGFHTSSSHSSGGGFSSSGSSSHSYSGGVGGHLDFKVVVVVVIIIIVFSLVSKYIKGNGGNAAQGGEVYEDIPENVPTGNIESWFVEAEFESNFNNVFHQIYKAWQEQNLTLLKAYESENVYNLHASMIRELQNKNQKNFMENICIEYVDVISAEEKNGYQYVKARVIATLNDYTVDLGTGKVVDGSKTAKDRFCEFWTLKRKEGVQDKPQDMTKCPNCGAPLDLNSDGACQYCSTIIANGDYSWVLANIEQGYEH